ncbi:hypothetical protein [Rhizobium sp. Leaf391]|uniref:hypothetical protein n=1 Tax=Rhizobium sp. Leaf391 TaxID=1736360 RepID=UPI000AC1F48E|nr:hypothetical protein [Rhizobium sp. Leaf391]
MSPELQVIFDRRMRPKRMHALLAAEWFNVEDAVEDCIGNLDAGRIGCDEIKAFMHDRFSHLNGFQKALVTTNATTRARTCFSDLQLQREERA